MHYTRIVTYNLYQKIFRTSPTDHIYNVIMELLDGKFNDQPASCHSFADEGWHSYVDHFYLIIPLVDQLRVYELDGPVWKT